METTLTVTLIGGLVTGLAILANKFKCYITRTSDGNINITVGLLVKPLPTNDKRSNRFINS